MTSNRENFLELRAQEMCTLYSSDFTKKDAIKTGENLIDSILESGEVDIMQLGANLVRLQQVISSAVDKFRNHIIDTEKVKNIIISLKTHNNVMKAYKELSLIMHSHKWDSLG